MRDRNILVTKTSFCLELFLSFINLPVISVPISVRYYEFVSPTESVPKSLSVI